MNEFRPDVFTGFEKQIRDARLTRSAMIGEVIGNGLGEAWISAQRVVIWISNAMTARFAAFKRQKSQKPLCQHLEFLPRTETPH